MQGREGDQTQKGLGMRKKEIRKGGIFFPISQLLRWLGIEVRFDWKRVVRGSPKKDIPKRVRR